MSELKPCPSPACKSEDVKAECDFVYKFIQCNDCFMRGPGVNWLDGAVAAWNALPREESSE